MKTNAAYSRVEATQIGYHVTIFDSNNQEIAFQRFNFNSLPDKEWQGILHSVYDRVKAYCKSFGV